MYENHDQLLSQAEDERGKGSMHAAYNSLACSDRFDAQHRWLKLQRRLPPIASQERHQEHHRSCNRIDEMASEGSVTRQSTFSLSGRIKSSGGHEVFETVCHSYLHLEMRKIFGRFSLDAASQWHSGLL